MSLLVVPLKSTLATSPSPYHVHTEWSDTVEYEKLVDIMATGRTTLTKPDIAGCLQLFTEEIAKLVADGKYVKTTLGAFYLCASGNLDSPDQDFAPGKGDGSHALRLHFRPARDFEAELRAKAAVERGKNYDRRTPVIYKALSVKSEADMSSGAGDFLRIEGQRLKFDKANAAEGLFFVNGTETSTQRSCPASSSPRCRPTSRPGPTPSPSAASRAARTSTRAAPPSPSPSRNTKYP
jgi:hypothetical protein